jgi:hypothetical protein
MPELPARPAIILLQSKICKPHAFRAAAAGFMTFDDL